MEEIMSVLQPIIEKILGLFEDGVDFSSIIETIKTAIGGIIGG